MVINYELQWALQIPFLMAQMKATLMVTLKAFQLEQLMMYRLASLKCQCLVLLILPKLEELSATEGAWLGEYE